MNVFEAQGIRKTYGETKAVDGVDLSLSAGEIVTILGHNGSGKTTFLECVEGLRKPDAGTVTLCGKVHAYGSPGVVRKLLTVCLCGFCPGRLV